jgi:hydroxymethylbilane synthase
MRELIIATRGSKLALWQSEYIKSKIEEKYPDISVKLNIMKTKGDKILDTPLAKIGGKGLFTKELEEAMLRGEAHIAVHSLKDVPVVFPKGLKLGAITKREDVRDAVLSQKYDNISALPKGAVVGTTSLRRRMQLLYARPDLVIKNLRGNINTRIEKLKNGEFDAVILAAAGVKRLELENEVRYFSPMNIDFMIPASGQAALGIEAVDKLEILEIIDFLNDESAIIETTIERDFVEKLEGGCQVPIGVNAKLSGDSLSIKGVVGLPDGKELLYADIKTVKSAYKEAGFDLADMIIEKGARGVLKRAEKMALETIFN